MAITKIKPYGIDGNFATGYTGQSVVDGEGLTAKSLRWQGSNGQSIYDYVSGVSSQSKVWKEALLCTEQLLGRTGVGSPTIKGIRSATLLVIRGNAPAGYTINVYDGDQTLPITVSSGSTPATIAAAIEAELNTTPASALFALAVPKGSTGAHNFDELIGTTTGDYAVLLYDNDPSNVNSTAVFKVSASAVQSGHLLFTADNYQAMVTELVDVPGSVPSVSNFGFHRVEETGGLVAGETHYIRCNDSIWSWDDDANLWNQTGGKGTYSDGNGIDIVGNVISVELASSDPGLYFNGTGLSVDLSATSGLALGAGGLALDPTYSVVTKKFVSSTGGEDRGSATNIALTGVLYTKYKTSIVFAAGFGPMFEGSDYVIADNAGTAELQWLNEYGTGAYEITVWYETSASAA